MDDLNPWQRGVLTEWSIVGMNHYHINGRRCLFVAMTKGGKCIVEEGHDDKYLWNRLWRKAEEAAVGGVPELGQQTKQPSGADDPLPPLR